MRKGPAWELGGRWMYFSLSDYKARTQGLKLFSASDTNGLYMSWPERLLFTWASRLWRAAYSSALSSPYGAVRPAVLAHPSPLQPEHVADCKIYANREAMIETLDKGKVWAELGTFEGAFAKQILETCAPSELNVFDLDFGGVRSAGHITETAPIKFCEGDSATSIGKFPDAYFDYIYIDAGHDLSAVARDVDAARPKLKPDGLLLFNDYIIYSHIDQLPFGVVPVVNSLCNEDGWTIVGFALHEKMFCDVALRRAH